MNYRKKLKKEILRDIYKPLSLEILFFFLCTTSAALMPYMNKILFDESRIKDSMFLIKLFSIYAFLILSRNIFSYLTQLYEWKTEKKYAVSLRNKIFISAYNKRANEYDKLTIGKYVSLINNNVDAISEEYLEALYNMINSIMQLIINGCILFIFIDWKVALVIFSSSMLSLIIPKLTANKLANKRNNYIKSLGDYISIVTDLFKGNHALDTKSKKSIKSYQLKNVEIMENKKYQWGIFKSLLNIINSFIMDIISLSAFIIIGILLFKKEITIGTGVATLSYITIFIYPIDTILKSINSIHSSKDMMGDLGEFLFDHPVIDDSILDKIDGINTIQFQNVSVKRGDFELKNFTYTFEKNKTYAITGHSGSGKSTILDILSGKIKINRGSVLINHIDVTDYLDIIAMRYFSIINQESHIFKASFIDNITNFKAYNKNLVKKEYLNINLLDKIRNTDSDNLSGGEKQILSIIKASISEKQIFLFDEVCSAMDKKTEKQIREYIKNLDYTILIEVNHHITDDYSHILQLEDGILKKDL